jgi:hypothetical protein
MYRSRAGSASGNAFLVVFLTVSPLLQIRLSLRLLAGFLVDSFTLSFY